MATELKRSSGGLFPESGRKAVEDGGFNQNFCNTLNTPDVNNETSYL
jgi:hypothetical protein